jgi:hypothetical protein
MNTQTTPAFYSIGVVNLFIHHQINIRRKMGNTMFIHPSPSCGSKIHAGCATIYHFPNKWHFGMLLQRF